MVHTKHNLDYSLDHESNMFTQCPAPIGLFSGLDSRIKFSMKIFHA